MQTIYETNRLILRILSPNWFEEVYHFLNNNKELFDPFEPEKPDDFYSKNFQKLLLAQEYKSFKNNLFMRFYAFSKEEPNKIIGSISFGNIHGDPFYSCILGYKFDQNYHGKGYALEAVSACVSIVLEYLNLHRITAYIMPSNTASIKLIEKLNFLYEGTSLRLVNIGGNWEDHLKYTYINYLLE